MSIRVMRYSANERGLFVQLGKGKGTWGGRVEAFWNSSHELQVHRKGKWGRLVLAGKLGKWVLFGQLGSREDRVVIFFPFPRSWLFIPGSQQSRGPSEGYSYPVCTTCGRRHPGECRRAAGTCFKCGQAGHLQKDCKKNTTASTSGPADKKPGASGRVFAITEGHASNTS
nr:hypothetical protein [Tanacetum cinerariifolium]